MIENGLTIDMDRREIRIGDKSKGVKWREGVKGHEDKIEAKEKGEGLVVEQVD